MKTYPSFTSLPALLLSLIMVLNAGCSERKVLYPDDLEALVASINTLSEDFIQDERVEAARLDTLVRLSAQLQRVLAQNPDLDTLNILLSETNTELSRLHTTLIAEDALLTARLGALHSEIQRLDQKIASTERTQYMVNQPIWEFLRALLWPTLAVLLVSILLIFKGAREKIQELFRPLKSFSAFGLTFLLDEETKKRADEVIANYRKETQQEFDKWVEKKKLEYTMQRLIDEEVKPRLLSQGHEPNFRATIHVEDLLFDDTLYQLLDYYPEGNERGRAFTTRFGIIGKAWRSKQSQHAYIPSPDTSDLILEWGMTPTEAQNKGKGRQSFLAILLRDDKQNNVGIFYIDSHEPNLFDDAWINFIEAKCKERNITRELTRMKGDLHQKAPQIKVHDR